MKFMLASFATSLDATLVEKGKKWYSEGMVQHLRNENECIWHADIIGPNKQFKVEVEIVGKEVDHTSQYHNRGFLEHKQQIEETIKKY